MLAVLSIFAAIGIVYGVATSDVDAATKTVTDQEIATQRLANMQYNDNEQFHRLVKCANAPWFGKNW